MHHHFAEMEQHHHQEALFPFHRHMTFYDMIGLFLHIRGLRRIGKFQLTPRRAYMAGPRKCIVFLNLHVFWKHSPEHTHHNLFYAISNSVGLWNFRHLTSCESPDHRTEDSSVQWYLIRGHVRKVRTSWSTISYKGTCTKSKCAYVMIHATCTKYQLTWGMWPHSNRVQ
jgi:hypothetical protein